MPNRSNVLFDVACPPPSEKRVKTQSQHTLPLALCLTSKAQDWGHRTGATLYADSSATLAIARRKGACKLRHMNVSALWIQDIQDWEGAQYMNKLGTENPADLMTKYLAREQLDACMQSIGQYIRQEKAKNGLGIQGAPSS